jgi:hypothetical protein
LPGIAAFLSPFLEKDSDWEDFPAEYTFAFPSVTEEYAMQRALLTWSALGLLALATGCSVCSSPYDYCGPTFAGGDCGACDTRTRSGSILAPADMPGGMGQVAGGPMVGPQGNGPMMGPEVTGPMIESDQEMIQEGTPVQKSAPEPTPAAPPRSTRTMSRMQR